MKIGDRIKARRKEMKISAEELGARLGKDRSTIYRYEKGDIENLPLDILEPIASALNTTPQYLMGWDEEVKKEIKKNPVKMAELHFEMVEDIDLADLFQDFKLLDARERKIVKDLAHSLAETKKAEV